MSFNYREFLKELVPGSLAKYGEPILGKFGKYSFGLCDVLVSGVLLFELFRGNYDFVIKAGTPYAIIKGFYALEQGAANQPNVKMFHSVS